MKRLLSLDVFRGITIAGMILVNSPGNNTAYPLLEHSAWNGCTFADLVFPFFIFIVGVTLAFSLPKYLAPGPGRDALELKILKRSVIIFAIGLLLNAIPHFNLSTLRILGVLQRIAICYGIAAFLFLTTRARTQALIMGGLLIGYWLILMPGDLTKTNNLGAIVDRFILGAHTYTPIYDPEGFLSTLPAIATALLGNLTGIWLRTENTQTRKLLGMLLAGTILAGIGWVWSLWFPINKALWTSSFVLWTGGLALLLLTTCYWLIEIKHWQRWSKPWEIFGINAIAVYVLHILLLKAQNLIHLTNTDGTVVNLRLFITAHLFGWATSNNASLLYALSYVLLWLAVLTVMYRQRIFIKI